MTPDEIRDFVRRYAEHLNAHDAAVVAADHAENGIVESPSTGTHRGRLEIAQWYDLWMTAFPDLAFTVEDVVAENSQAVLFFRLTGTQRGKFLGLPATGKRIEFRGVFLQRLENEQIVHERCIYDFSGVLIKLGVLTVKLR